MAWVAQDRLKAKGRENPVLPNLPDWHFNWAWLKGVVRFWSSLYLSQAIKQAKRGTEVSWILLSEERRFLKEKPPDEGFLNTRFEHPFCSAHSRSFTRYWKGGITTSKLLSLNSPLTLSLVPSLSILLFVAPPGFYGQATLETGH